jgi:phenylacetate-CoA ligase
MAKKSRRRPLRTPVPAELFRVRSVLSNVLWPGSGSANTNVVLAFLYQLQLSQWWSRAELERATLAQLREIVACAARNPLYRTRFDAAGIVAGDALTAAGWQQLEPLRFADLAAFVRNGPVAVPPSHGGDAPIVWRDGAREPALRRSAITAFFDAALRLRELQWHAREPGGAVVRVDAVHPGASGSVAGRDGWDTAFGCLGATANRAVLAATESPAAIVAALRRTGADVLECSSATLAALLAHASEMKMPPLRLVRMHGDTPHDALRAAATSAFGASVRFHLAHPLTGAIAFECAEHGALHVQAEHVHVELVDAHDSAVAPGASGRLLVTDLHNLRQPVPRFDTGWSARWGAPCACGRGLPVLELPAGQPT